MMHGVQRCVGSDVIYTERRGQSLKPEEIYQLIEELVPAGDHLAPAASESSAFAHSLIKFCKQQLPECCSIACLQSFSQMCVRQLSQICDICVHRL